MAEKIHDVALTLPCRHKNCHAVAGQPCNGYLRGIVRFHQVRYNDAYRVLNDQAKIADWEKRYGEKRA